MKTKSFIVTLLCVLMTLCLVFAACDRKGGANDGHEHTFSSKWTTDELYHWHAATCGHDDEVTGKAEHTFVDGACSVCKLKLPESGNFALYAAKPITETPQVLPEAGSISAESLVLHYRRIDPNTYPHWGFWLWSGSDGIRYPLTQQDDFGGIAIVPLSDMGGADTKIGLIPIDDNDPDGPNGSGWYTKDSAGADRYFAPKDFLSDDGNYHLYIVESDGKIYKDAESTDYDKLNYMIDAQFVNRSKIEVRFATNVKKVEIYEDGTKLDEYTGKVSGVDYKLGKEATIGKKYVVKAVFELNDKEMETTADIRIFYNDPEFATTFYYAGDDLGATLYPSSTTFKVWSPVSNKISLNLYYNGDGDDDPYETYEMTMDETGVWSYTVPERLAGRYYTYTVYNSANPGGAEIVDPYAKSAGLNGLRGMVVDFNSGVLKPDGWDDIKPVDYDANELVVWETHVADVTSSSTWTAGSETRVLRKTFKGMIKEGTTYTEKVNGQDFTVKTGFDHIVELGVNAVQILPIFDQTNDEESLVFNWGYNPLNYNVLEGSYSTDPHDGYNRIREFRDLVMAFNKHGINIIMDVVYNHVSDAGSSNFEALMPGYYFRYKPDGTAAKESACGNDTMSERPMFRKFMVDSVCFWAKEYKFGGFRFDIMGLHDLETMRVVTEAVRQINPNAVFYGEAWGKNYPTGIEMASQAYADSFPAGLSQFNDRMRDQVKEFAQNGGGDSGQVIDGFMGSTTGVTNVRDLYKTLNYVSCHDNYSIKDDFMVKRRMTDQTTIAKAATLSNSMILSSNGISFFLAGDEFLRSKKDLGATDKQADNSYNASYEINSLDYSLKIKNYDMFQNYQHMIKFKEMFGRGRNYEGWDENYEGKGFELDDNSKIGVEASSTDTVKYDVNLSGGVYYINIFAPDGTHWMVAHAGPKPDTKSFDWSQFDLWWSTTGNKDNATLQPYETKIVKTQG